MALKWWKIYFWVFTSYTALAVVGLTEAIIFHTAAKQMELTFPISALMINILLQVVSVIAIRVYVYRKKLGNESLWKMLFYLYCVYWFVYILIDFFPSLSIHTALYFLVGNVGIRNLLMLFSLIFAFAVNFPALYAMYRLGEDKGREIK
jgi:hypothetical protein